MKVLTLPASVEHAPYGREYSNTQEAQVAFEQFNDELDKLLERYGMHAFIFNGSLLVKAVSVPVATPTGVLEQIRTKAVCRADGCKACCMYAVAQGAAFNQEQNDILIGAYAMLEQSLRDDTATNTPDLNEMEVKGPKQ